MKRNLNVKVKARAGTELSETQTDFVVNALDYFNGKAPEGITKRAIGALAGRIFAAKTPPAKGPGSDGSVDLSPEDANLIVAALEASTYPAFVVEQIAKYLEAK